MRNDDDDFLDYMIYQEIYGKGSKSSDSKGGCGCCCMPVLVAIGLIGLLIGLL